MQITKKVFKMIPAWKDDQEEKWLTEMGKQGWLFKKYAFPLYTFERTEPKEFVYKLDFVKNQHFDKAEYITLFEDAGWEHAAEWNGWHYFRTEKSADNVPDIYSDTASRIQKYNLLLSILFTSLISLSIIGALLVFPSKLAFMLVLKVIYLAGILFLSYAVIRLFMKTKELKKDN